MSLHVLPDVADLSVPLCCLGASFIVSFGLVKSISPVISPLLYPAYALLTRAKQVDWDTRVASNVHAVLVCVLLYFIFAYEESIYKNPAWGESLLSRITCAIVIGYLLSDMAVIMMDWSHIGNTGYLVHHVATIIPYYCVLRYGVMAFFAMYRLWAELSTPFVNKRWAFDSLKYDKSSAAYIVNGLIMTATFFLARILPIPYFYWKLFQVRHDEDYQWRTWPFFIVAFYSCVVLDILNVFWMIKIMKGAIKVLKGVQRIDKNENKVKSN